MLKIKRNLSNVILLTRESTGPCNANSMNEGMFWLGSYDYMYGSPIWNRTELGVNGLVWLDVILYPVQ